MCAVIRCITSIVLYTKVDAQCHKLATVIGRTKLTKLVDELRCNFSKSRVWDKVPEGSTLVLEIPEFHCNTVLDKPRVACMPNMSLMHSAILTKYRVVTDRQTDTGR